MHRVGWSFWQRPDGTQPFALLGRRQDLKTVPRAARAGSCLVQALQVSDRPGVSYHTLVLGWSDRLAACMTARLHTPHQDYCG